MTISDENPTSPRSTPDACWRRRLCVGGWGKEEQAGEDSGRTLGTVFTDGERHGGAGGGQPIPPSAVQGRVDAHHVSTHRASLSRSTSHHPSLGPL